MDWSSSLDAGSLDAGRKRWTMRFMTLLSDLAILRARVAASPGRLEKRRLVADYLRGLSLEDVPRAVTYLSGRAFPATDPRVLNVRSLPAPEAASRAASLTLADVAEAFGAVAAAGGAGARSPRFPTPGAGRAGL